MRFFFLFCLSAMLFRAGYAQPARISGELIVELNDEKSLRQLVSALPHLALDPVQRLIPRFHYWLFRYDTTAISALDILKTLKQQPQVRLAQHNHAVSLRSPQNNTPNDPFFANQWQYLNTGAGGGAPDADLDAPEAWDITTGGLSVTGERIVIAIIDDGLDTQHPDLVSNIWYNTAEIDNNNLDDDQNGYVDDFGGWNSVQNNDDIGSGSAGLHGTSVAGIVGARGNNGIGVAGVNWTTSLMIIRNYANTSEANVLASYGYALTQRRIYNESNGTSGSLVVATNASWGINYGQPADAPLWCSFYDTLGKYGILNVAATANLNINVDSLGDLPTTCPSDYLIAVTNVNRLGEKLFSAGYGANSIDLGAFGESAYTTVYSSGYGSFGGTSAASPHVAGAVGLMYTAACANFMILAKIQPEQAALLAKDWILNGVVPAPSLSQTTSGGCLNLFNSVNLAVNNCPDNCYPPYNFYTDNVTEDRASLHWSEVATADTVWLRYRKVGTATWSAPIITTLTVKGFNGLETCTDYEVQLVSWCAGQLRSDTALVVFSTEGCCTAPLGLGVGNITAVAASATWTSLYAAQSYRLRFRPIGTTSWIYYNNITNTNKLLTGLDTCTQYEMQVAALCVSGDSTDFSPSFTFRTEGCHSCLDAAYCAAQGQSSTNDWIQRFSFGNFEYVSGNNGGYYSHNAGFIEVVPGETYTVSASQGESYLEYVRIWADWSQDGDFNDAYELAYEGSIPYVSSLTGSVTVPAFAELGNTRLRIAMRWNSNPDACGTMPYGEVEDYCLQINPYTATTAPESPAVTELQLYPNPFGNDFTLAYALAQPLEKVQISIFSATGQLVYFNDFDNLPSGNGSWQFTELGALPAGVYYLQWQDEKQRLQHKIIKN